jgi:hypothetical protein
MTNRSSSVHTQCSVTVPPYILVVGQHVQACSEAYQLTEHTHAQAISRALTLACCCWHDLPRHGVSVQRRSAEDVTNCDWNGTRTIQHQHQPPLGDATGPGARVGVMQEGWLQGIWSDLGAGHAISFGACLEGLQEVSVICYAYFYSFLTDINGVHLSRSSFYLNYVSLPVVEWV